MAVSFSIPKSPSKSIFQMNYFQGCDFTNSPGNIDDYKSPNCVNMVRDVPGKVRKSMGWHTVMKYPGSVNGSFYLRSSDEQLIHAGDGIYFNDVLIYKGANDHRSKAWQFEDKLYIQDGKELLVHECKKADVIEGYTYGHHKKDVSGLSYNIDMTISAGDKVYFKFPYKISNISISGVEAGVAHYSDGITEYTYTANTDGKHEFDCTAYAETKTVSTDNGLIELEKIGKGTVLNFSTDTGYKFHSIKQTYRDSNMIDRVVEYDDFDSNTWSWTNTFGDYKYNFEVVSKGASEGTGTFTGTIIQDGEPGMKMYYAYYSVGSVEKGTVFTFDTSTEEAKANMPRYAYCMIDRYTYSQRVLVYDKEKPDSFSITFDDEDFPEGSSNFVIFFDYSLLPVTPGTVVNIPYKWEKVETKKCSISYKNVLGMNGTASYTINRQYGTNGFIDNTDGNYIDEYNLLRTVKKVAEDAYIPTVTIAKEPNGGGTSYESLNLIQPGFIELFQGTETDKSYQLSFSGLDDTAVVVKLLNSNGDWVTKTEGTHFSVNRETGVITFNTAPGKSPLTGEDNISIQAYRTVEGYADRINKCTISILFGVHGNADRLFVSGNADYINYDWYSQQYDPTYFPDTGYAVLGSSSSAIVGYTIISNYLAAHKDDKERDTNIILREGDLVDNEPSFPIVATLQGAGAVAPWSFNYLETEPIFLTKRGIYAVTAQDITGEKYSQNRSYYIDGKLLKEDNLEDAYSCVFNDFYCLAVNGKMYLLDGLQPIQTDKSMPYATRQYACFYRENVPANCLWTFEEKLYFGTSDGKVCEFYTDKDDLYSYNDDGEPIPCVWETPDLDGKYFFKNKTFRYLAVRLDSAIATSINIYTMKRGIWNLAKSDSSKGMYFTFPYLNFVRFTFGTDTTQKIVHSKLRVKKVDKARFKFTNTALNEPFGLFDIALEYVENGNYKG